MIDRHEPPLVLPDVVVDGFFGQQARIAADVFQVDPRTWAIHGAIPVDGEVILAEFEHPDAARLVLERLATVRAAGAHVAPDRGARPRPVAAAAAPASVVVTSAVGDPYERSSRWSDPRVRRGDD